MLFTHAFCFSHDAGESRNLSITKVVTLRDFEQTEPSSTVEKWVKCFRVNDTLHELSTIHDWEIASVSHLLLHIDVPDQQLYHLPLLIMPVNCVYLITFDLRTEEKALRIIQKALKHIFVYVSYDSESKLGNHSPPTVLLIGTHQRPDQDLKQFKGKLQKSLKGKYADLIVKPTDGEFWSVEGEFEIQQSSIFEVIKSHSCQLKFPIRQWIQYNHKLREVFPKKTVVKSKLQSELPHVCDVDVELLLAFLHDYGFIVHSQYDTLAAEDTTVVLQPEYLCQLFSLVQKLSKQYTEVTVDVLFNRDPQLERSMKKWFQMFCICMGLVIEEPMGTGRKLVFALSRQLHCETAPSASCFYSVDPILVTFSESFLPFGFFPAFANEFLRGIKGDPDVQENDLDIATKQAHIVVGWDVGCYIHVLEQESCIEIGFQLVAIDSESEEERREAFKYLQKRCQLVKRVVVQSADKAVKNLKLPDGAPACVQYGFYQSCGNARVFGKHAHGYLKCCCHGRVAQCTPMQDIWFKDVMDSQQVGVLASVPLCVFLYIA